MTDNSNPNESDKGHLVSGGLASFSIKVASVVLGFGAQFLIARSLGNAGYGEFSFAWVTLNFLVIGAVAGGDSVATRFVASFRESPTLIRHCVKWLHRRSAIYAAILLSLALAALQVIRTMDDRTIWWVTQVLCLAIPFQVIASLRQGILRGRHRPVLAQMPEEIIRPGMTILLVLAAVNLWIGTDGRLPIAYVTVIVVLVSLVVLVIGQIFLWRELKQVPEPTEAVDPENMDSYWREWRSMAWASTFAALAMTIHSQCDIWMLGVMVDSQFVGPYAAAARYASFVILGINAVNTVLGPMVARSVRDHEELQRLASRAVKLSFSLSIVVVLALLFFPKILLGLFGNGFDQAATPLRILVLSNLFNVLCGSVGMLLNMSGHHGDFVRILGWSMLVNIVLNVVLIPFYGTVGAALATATSIALWNVLGWLLVRKRLKIRPTLGGWI